MKTIILFITFIFYTFCAHDCQADGCINDDCGAGFRDMVCNINNESIFNCNVNAIVTSECLIGNCTYIQCISPFTPVTNLGLNQTCTLNTDELCCPGLFVDKYYRICVGKNNNQTFYDEFKNITCSQYPCPVITPVIPPVIPCPTCQFCFLDNGLEYMIINGVTGSINTSALNDEWCNNLPLQCGDSIINNTGLCIPIIPSTNCSTPSNISECILCFSQGICNDTSVELFNTTTNISICILISNLDKTCNETTDLGCCDSLMIPLPDGNCTHPLPCNPPNNDCIKFPQCNNTVGCGLMECGIINFLCIAKDQITKWCLSGRCTCNNVIMSLPISQPVIVDNTPLVVGLVVFFIIIGSTIGIIFFMSISTPPLKEEEELLS